MEEHSDKIWTYDDLASLPDDGKRYEILDGVLFVSPSPRLRHQDVLKRLFVAFLALEQRKVAKVYFAPLDVILSPTKVVVPDLLVVRNERRSIFAERGVEGAPDLVIEVLSPSTAKHDRTRKRRFYAKNGVREYWIVDVVANSIEVLELIDGGLSYREHGWYGPGDTAKSAFIDLEVSVDALFAPDDDDLEQ
jgi:Uma2 family endonuclease